MKSSLEYIFPLNRIEASDISSMRFAVVTITTGIIIGALLAWLSYETLPDGTKLDSFLLPVTTFILILIAAGNIAMSVALARSTDSDIRQLAALQPGLDASLETVALGKPLVLGILAGNLLIYYGALFAIDIAVLPNRELLERLEIITSDLPLILLYSIAIPLMAISATPVSVMFIQQPRALTRIANNLDVQLKDLPSYQLISNAFVRTAVAYGVIATLFPLILLPAAEVPGPITAAMVLLIIVLACIALGYLYPVVVLRNRIRDYLQLEMQNITDEMSTEPEENLMVRQMYLESRPVWPIANNIQKILVVGILPPLAWVLAAAVENLLF